MKQVPVLFLGDSPNGPTGMGMILREICQRANTHLTDMCYVGAAGLRDDNSGRQPFPVYPFSDFDNWKIPQLPWIWKQFAGDRKGVIFSIMNITCLPWFACPQVLKADNPKEAELRDFMMSNRFEHWAYVPVDSEGPKGRLSDAEEVILRNIPRVLAYTQYGANVIDATLGNLLGTTEHIPHGTDEAIFYPRDRTEARARMLELVGIKGRVPDDLILVGIMATNTFRKDWPLALEVCGRLVERGHNIGVLIHTDAMRKDWNLNELCLRFGLKGMCIESVQKPGHVMPHEDVAWLYAACDLVLANGSGEGWGSSISEGLAMGVPVVHGNYAAGAGHLRNYPEWLVEPAAYRYDGFHLNKRPVFNPDDWVAVSEKIIAEGIREPRVSLYPKEMMWEQVWTLWSDWIKTGLEKL